MPALGTMRAELGRLSNRLLTGRSWVQFPPRAPSPCGETDHHRTLRRFSSQFKSGQGHQACGARLAEQPPFKRKAVGSNPTACTKLA
jgi:hypothetical protein